MKIITVNRNYFITGGPEKYLFAFMEGLKDWEFIPFAVDFPQNLKTSYQPYFVAPPSDQHTNRFDENYMSLWDKLKYAAKNIYSVEARKKLLKLIDETHPQAVFFLNAVYFSQSIIDACKKRKVPIIWRLSDFNLICGNYLLYRDGHICTECLDYGLGRLRANRCGGYQRSSSAALVRFMAMKLALHRNVYRHVDYFVCPSTFTREMMIKGGFPAEKMIYIPTFVRTDPDDKELPKANQFFFVGRISPEKGLGVLLRAAQMLKSTDWTLVVAGATDSDYAQSLMASIPDAIRAKIHFDGFVPQHQVKARILESRFVVVPSVWYENMPNVVLEAMALGRPVIASKLGSLEEMIKERENGLKFEAGNSEDLAAKIDHLLSEPNRAKEMGNRAKADMVEYHSPEGHFNALEDLFNKVSQGEYESL